TAIVSGCSHVKDQDDKKAIKQKSEAAPDFSNGEVCPVDDHFHFTTSGTPWANRTITFSFMPDGTKNPHDSASALFANLNGVASQEVWQKEVARALAAWTKHANLDFRMVSDDGSKAGSSGPAQGDPRFG